jgi:raffinose/stachyose/melibiose transport system permease protein
MEKPQVITNKEVKSKVKKARKITAGKVIVYIVLSFWALTTFLPMIWVLINSFKSTDEILRNSVSLPTSLSLTNYKSTFEFLNIGRAFINSFIISGSVVFLVCLIGGLAAFVLARFHFRFKKQIKAFLFISMLVPQFAVIIPNLITLTKLNLKGTYLTIIIPQTAAFLNFAILLLAGYMSGIPRELEEAAIIDGCSVPQIFFKVIFPVSVPGFSTAAIVTFLWSYNDLLLSLVYVSDRAMQPVCVILSLVSSIYGTNYGAMMAAIVMTILPVLILYSISQEYLQKGLTSGAVKG